MDALVILGLRVSGDPVILREDPPFSELEREYGATIWNMKITIDAIEERFDSLGDIANDDFIRSSDAAQKDIQATQFNAKNIEVLNNINLEKKDGTVEPYCNAATGIGNGYIQPSLGCPTSSNKDFIIEQSQEVEPGKPRRENLSHKGEFLGDMEAGDMALENKVKNEAPVESPTSVLEDEEPQNEPRKTKNPTVAAIASNPRPELQVAVITRRSCCPEANETHRQAHKREKGERGREREKWAEEEEKKEEKKKTEEGGGGWTEKLGETQIKVMLS
ncbi:hypothetical protein Vadar_019266 [Vaccinium darrowii]|uniref:Uncharacterized protein n=1 Tax=Vaccinium darrowii TaxID=229202 RepID=A0ACB7XB98_9ERIC|nr:hypothetical protein Vadar_019266 [Vaccinium darrowii]